MSLTSYRAAPPRVIEAAGTAVLIVRFLAKPKYRLSIPYLTTTMGRFEGGPLVLSGRCRHIVFKDDDVALENC
jgi:hypothetical protein